MEVSSYVSYSLGRRSATALVAAAAIASCSRYGLASRPSHGGRPTGPIVRVGDGVALPDGVSDVPISSPRGVPTTEVSMPPLSGGASSRAISGGPARGPANVGTRDDASGFRLSLVVGGRLRYSPADDIDLDLDVVNTSDRTLQYDSNAPTYFGLFSSDGTNVWRDSDCHDDNRRDSFTGGPIDLAPGESVRFKATYPSGRSTTDRARCRVGSGSYGFVGAITWCPPGSLQMSGSCDTTKTKLLTSPLVRITIQ